MYLVDNNLLNSFSFTIIGKFIGTVTCNKNDVYHNL